MAEKKKSPPVKHGMRYSKEYTTWTAIKNRCHCKTAKDYKKYGAKGISVHPAWREDFLSFLSDIGFASSEKHQIDRINTRFGYVPGNVRWATPKEQAQNRQTSYLWEIKGFVFNSAQDAADFHKVSDATIHRWVHGSFDKRRNKFTKPVEGCYAYPRY